MSAALACRPSVYRTRVANSRRDEGALGEGQSGSQGDTRSSGKLVLGILPWATLRDITASFELMARARARTPITLAMIFNALITIGT